MVQNLYQQIERIPISHSKRRPSNTFGRDRSTGEGNDNFTNRLLRMQILSRSTSISHQHVCMALLTTLILEATMHNFYAVLEASVSQPLLVGSYLVAPLDGQIGITMKELYYLAALRLGIPGLSHMPGV